MKNTKKRFSKTIALICAIVVVLTCAIIAAANENMAIANAQNNIENAYYEANYDSLVDNVFYNENAEILNGGFVDSSKIVQGYKPKYDTLTNSGFNSFVNAYKEGKKFYELVEPSEWYYTVVTQNDGDSASSAVMKKDGNNFVIGAVYNGDNGSLFTYPTNSRLSANIALDLNMNNLDAKLITLYGVGYGILFHDSEREYVVFTYPCEGVNISKGTIYTAEEVITIISECKNNIVRDGVEFEINEDGETNYITG